MNDEKVKKKYKMEHERPICIEKPIYFACDISESVCSCEFFSRRCFFRLLFAWFVSPISVFTVMQNTNKRQHKKSVKKKTKHFHMQKKYDFGHIDYFPLYLFFDNREERKLFNLRLTFFAPIFSLFCLNFRWRAFCICIDLKDTNCSQN